MPTSNIDTRAVLDLMATQPAAAWLVADLRSRLPGPPEPLDLIDALRVLEREGLVQRDAFVGRWSLLRRVDRGGGSNRAIPATPHSMPPPDTGTSRIAGVIPHLTLPTDLAHPPASEGGEFSLDPSQEAVVTAPIKERQVVEAGPGFGKTAVACARVAWLLEQGVPGSQILLLSFTRTAVREMRQRIRLLAAEGLPVWDVEIRTIDSWAARLRAGFHSATTPPAGFDQGILDVVRLLGSPPDALRDHIGQLRHVFVDEAQDLVGHRARLILAMLGLLRDELAGFTIFHDPAQAIYDWSENLQGQPSELAPVAFFDVLAGATPPPLKRSLRCLHRTADPHLRTLLLAAREFVLHPTSPTPATKLHEILQHGAHERSIAGESIVDFVRQLEPETLVLFRRRAEVLAASAWLSGHDVPHRLRFGGLPQVAAPWLAALLGDVFLATEGNTLPSRGSVLAAWEALAPERLKVGWDFDKVWRSLRAMGAQGRLQIDIPRIADAIARRSLPDDLFCKEVGPQGPILGTVHGSKGREAPRVVFMLPRRRDAAGDEDTGPQGGDYITAISADQRQEARVLYVAISRAKERLDIYPEQWFHGKWLPNGRVYQSKQNSFRMEVGRENDVDPVAALLRSPGGGQRQQDWLREFDGSIRSLTASLCREGTTWWWSCKHPEGFDDRVVAVLDGRVNSAFFDVVHTKGFRKTSGEAHHLYWLDLGTVAIPADHPLLPQIPHPWRTTRVLLAPIVVGLGRTYGWR